MSAPTGFPADPLILAGIIVGVAITERRKKQRRAAHAANVEAAYRSEQTLRWSHIDPATQRRALRALLEASR